jgi:hypothetical protein
MFQVAGMYNDEEISDELIAEVDEDALLNYLKARYPASYLYLNPAAEPQDRILKPGIGVIDRGSAILPIEEFLPEDRVDAIQAAKAVIAKSSKDAADAGRPRIIKLTDSCDLMCTACYPIHDCGTWHSIQMVDVSCHLNGGRCTDRRTKAGKIPRNSHDDVENNFVPTHVVSTCGPGIIDWTSPIVPCKHPWDRSPDDPWTFAEVDALHAEVLTGADPTTHYTYAKFPEGPVTVVAKSVKHNEQWYAKYLSLLGRGAPSPVLMTGKAVTHRIKACLGPEGGRIFKLVDAVCEDCGLISEYPGIDESEDGYGKDPSMTDYEPLSNFEMGARAKDAAKASTTPAGDLVRGNDIHIGGKAGVATLAREARSLSKATTGGRLSSRRYSTVRNSYGAGTSVISGMDSSVQGVITRITYGQILDEVRDWVRINRGILPKPEVKHDAKPGNYNAVDTCREEGWLSIIIQHIKLAAKDGDDLTAADLVRITSLTRKEVDLCIDILSGTRIRRRTGIFGQPRIKVVPRGRNKLLKLISPNRS